MAVEYRDSLYQDNNRYISGIEIKRDDRRYKASIQALWQMTEDWNVNISYNYLDNKSNIKIYDYQQTLIKLGLAWEIR